MVKPVTSLALCALFLASVAPASAAPLEASSSTTLEVSASAAVAPPVVSRAPTTRPTAHRQRKTTKRKSVAKVLEHRAEPVRSPVFAPAAVASTPLRLTKVRVTKVKATRESRPTSRAGTGAEIVIGAKSEAKSQAVPSTAIPAEIEVKQESRQAPVKPASGSGFKASFDARPVTTRATTPSGDAPSAPHVTLDVGTGDAKVVAPATGGSGGPRAAKTAGRSCLHEGVEFVRGQEVQTFPLTRCDGSVAPLALEKLSILARPESAPLPKSASELARVKGPDLATGIRRVDPGLALRVQTIADHFAKMGQIKVSVVSGYRPMSSGSYHATGQALDLRVEGVPNEAVVEFCKTLVDTGCGYYPNSSFVHVDVRQPGTGHVAWIDASGPGEPPHYVASWPPPPEPEVKSAENLDNPIDKLDPELPPLPSDDHPAAPGVSAVVSAPLDVAK